MSRRFGPVLAVAWALTVCGCTLEQRTDVAASRQAAQGEESPRRQIIQPEGVARLPVFSSAVRSGDLLFLSGALGALQGTETPTLVEGGIGPETRQTMENIRTVLAAAGLTMEDLVKCTVFLADIADYAAMNDVYVEYFPSDPPIECVAAYPAGG
ncbi:MAG: RidA family protein [Planctomycetota bacterium]|jgi:2-iminobutanoate/2-iminopropanoate deaminase